MEQNIAVGLFSLPPELHSLISCFATPSSIISLSKTCRIAYQIYNPLHLERLVQLTRISIANDGLDPFEFPEDSGGNQLEIAMKGAFHERMIEILTYRAPVEIVKRFFDLHGWDMKKDLTDTYSTHLKDISDPDDLYNPGPLPPHLALLPLQILFLIIQEIPEPFFLANLPFLTTFTASCTQTSTTPPTYTLPPLALTSTLPPSLRPLTLLALLTLHLSPHLNTFAMPFYVPFFHLHYPSLATYLIAHGLSPHVRYPPPPHGPHDKLLRYAKRLNPRMLSLLLSHGVNPNTRSPIASCSLQRAIHGHHPHANPLVDMTPLEILFSGHTIPGFGDVEELRREDVGDVGEMVERAVQCYDVLVRGGAVVDRERIEEMVVGGWRTVRAIYAEGEVGGWSHNCGFIAAYLRGLGTRLGIEGFEPQERRRRRWCGWGR